MHKKRIKPRNRKIRRLYQFVLVCLAFKKCFFCKKPLLTMKDVKSKGFLAKQNYIVCLSEYDKTSIFKLTVHHKDHNRNHNLEPNLKFCHRKCHKGYHLHDGKGE